MTPQEKIEKEYEKLSLLCRVEKCEEPVDYLGYQIMRWEYQAYFQKSKRSRVVKMNLFVPVTEKAPSPAKILAINCMDYLEAQRSYEDWLFHFCMRNTPERKELWEYCRKVLPKGFLTAETRKKLAELADKL